MNFYVDVVLPIPVERLFTYSLTALEATNLKMGMRVAVPFGKSKIYTALVMEVHQVPPQAYEAKPIHQILDNSPLVNSIQLTHWKWLAMYYMCTLGEVFRAALPGILLLESETIVMPTRLEAEAKEGFTEDELIVIEALKNKGAITVAEIASLLERKSALPVLNQLLSKEMILIKESIKEQYKPRTRRYIRLAPAYQSEEKLEAILQDLTRAPQQTNVLLTFFQIQASSKGPIALKKLKKQAQVSDAVIRSLLDKGIMEDFLLREDRLTYEASGELLPSKELNAEQDTALKTIRECFSNKKVCLLQGVTSSGKTEIYVKLIEEYLAKGKQILYLLPEIALTAQLINRLRAYFGSSISVYHSRYNMQERVEVWNKVLVGDQKAQIVLGARSALFLPFSNLGLVLVDEEHETSYKQYDPAPRYHARDAAIVLAREHGSEVLLGSATPSIESYHNVKTGKYGVAKLENRYGNVLMPEIALVDIKELNRKKRMKGHFSDFLQNAIQQTLSDGEQVILFQNRRGFAPIVECLTCGHSPQCPNCDVSLTYHRHRNQLRCHYCGHSTEHREECEACGNYSLNTRGFGTQQVEDEVKELFPGARVGRMDFDTTRGKHAFANIIHSFEQGEIDILVGTQMLTKGLDFRHVGLVGIMNADSLLNFPDFRSHERSFQMLTQVSGRAGRTHKRGRVLIQTFNPHHRILQQVMEGDYDGMYANQLHERKQYQYPPFNRLIRITFKHRDFQKVNEASAWYAGALKNRFNGPVLGPEFPAISRIRNQYLKNLLIKIPDGWSVIKTKNSIKRTEKSFYAVSQFRSVRLIYDVDYI